MTLFMQRTGWPAYALASVLASCVSGCASDETQDPQLTGTFNDGPVSNLDFTVGSTEGKTGPDGSFNYTSPSDQITFSVGDIVLGTGTVKTFMTPVDIVPGAVDENDGAVTNIARFLQTLDEDGDLSNGIQIPEGAADAAAGRSIDFNQTPEAFEGDANVQAVLAALTTRALVSAEDARSELQKTILARLAGDYAGSFSGEASGCWTLNVDDTGAVTGTFDVENIPGQGPVTVPLTGMIPSSGLFSLTGSQPPLTVTIDGTTNTEGDASGSWSLVSEGVTIATGSFSGGEGQSCMPDGNGFMDEACPPANAARFVFTPSGDGEPFTVCPAAIFDCQGEFGGACALQVFDIAGSDRFLQFSTTTAPFMVNINFCFGFEFVVDEPGVAPGAGRGLANTFGEPTGRQFGDLDPDNPTPFATGEYSFRDDFQPLGTFEFYEDGFIGFQIPTRACPF